MVNEPVDHCDGDDVVAEDLAPRAERLLAGDDQGRALVLEATGNALAIARLLRPHVDFDATPISAHSDKELAAGHYKGGFGFHPLLATCGREVLAANSHSPKSTSAAQRTRPTGFLTNGG